MAAALVRSFSWARLLGLLRQRPAPELEDMSKEELYRRAQEAEIPGRSSMTKDELLEALGSRKEE